MPSKHHFALANKTCYAAVINYNDLLQKRWSTEQTDLVNAVVRKSMNASQSPFEQLIANDHEVTAFYEAFKRGRSHDIEYCCLVAMNGFKKIVAAQPIEIRPMIRENLRRDGDSFVFEDLPRYS